MLTLRNEKGSPLTHEEMDANFIYLDQKTSGDSVRIEQKCYRGVSPEEPYCFQIDGTLRSVFGTDNHNAIVNIRCVYRVSDSIIEKKGTVLINFRNDKGTYLYVTSLGDITGDNISSAMYSPSGLPDRVSGTVDIYFPKIDGGAVIYWETSMVTDDRLEFVGDTGVLFRSKAS